MTFPKSNEYNKITSLERYFCSYQAKTQDSNSVINNIKLNLNNIIDDYDNTISNNLNYYFDKIIGNLQQQLNSLKINNKKMQEKIENYEKKKICCVCLSNESNIVLINCGHACLCEECSIELKQQVFSNNINCPICRTNSSMIKIYFN